MKEKACGAVVYKEENNELKFLLVYQNVGHYSFNDAVVILDEAQNTTIPQLKMFLTRMGMNTKMIVTGDLTQIDLPSSVRSGLSHAMHLLRGIKGIGIVELNKKDIVRHKLVTRIVEAYEKEKGGLPPVPPKEG